MIAKNRFLNLVTLAAASVLTCAGGAQAAPVLVSGNTVPITTNPSSGSVTLNDYSVFRITLTPLATERITSIDVDTGSFGITGALHQRWTKTTDPDTGDVTVNPSPRQTSAEVGSALLDSHFKFTSAGTTDAISLISIIDPGENNNVSPSPLADTANFDFGLGDAMQAAVGLTSTTPGQAIDFLYLVIPDSNSVTVRGLFTTTTIAGVTTGNEQMFTVSAIPEPTGLALAGLGASALLARRRLRADR